MFMNHDLNESQYWSVRIEIREENLKTPCDEL